MSRAPTDLPRFSVQHTLGEYSSGTILVRSGSVTVQKKPCEQPLIWMAYPDARPLKGTWHQFLGSVVRTGSLRATHCDLLSEISFLLARN